MARPTSRTTWRNGSKAKAWATSAACRTTRRSATWPPPVRGPWRAGKIERWHQTLKNVRRGNDPPDRFLILLTLLENYCLPGALEQAIEAFIDHYNHRRYHESLGNLTPADVYLGRGNDILSERRKIKEQTLKQRRLLNLRQAA